MGNKHKIVVLVLFSTLCFGAFDGENDVEDGNVHVIIQQRSGRKPLTLVRGIYQKYSMEKILKDFKADCACNGNVILDSQHGKVLQLQGDQSEKIRNFLTNAGLVKANKITVERPYLHIF